VQNDQQGAQNEIVCRVFGEVRAQEGRLDNIVRVLSFHPAFLQEFVNTYNYLMYKQGALAYDSRHYIAIMAASRHQCIYLVKQQETEFLNAGGQKSWLAGLQHIPQKLSDLNELNKLLCHQPWLINRSHVEKILKGQYSWSITELIMAITVLAHFHALSGFVFGVGIHENYMQCLQLEYQANEARREVEMQQKVEQERRLAHEKQMSAGDAEFDDFDNESEEEEEDEELNDLDDGEFYYNDENNISNGIPFSLNGVTSGANALQSDGGRGSQVGSYGANKQSFRHRSDSTGTANRTLSNSVSVFFSILSPNPLKT
jgi:hypothetical protein